MALDLGSLKKAVTSLERALNVAASEKMSILSDDEMEVIKAGVIQNFEFTYELCWKFMKRWLETNMGAAYVDGVTRRELFRLGAEHRLIQDVDLWMDYHKTRNQTAHTYNEKTAGEVFEAATKFIHDAKWFLEAIEERND